MPRVPFDQLPGDARLWIFAAERELNDTEQRRLLAEIDAFLDGWNAHDVPLAAGRTLRYDRFVFIGVDEAAAGVSGCSIDALVRNVKRLETELGLRLVEHGPVLFRKNGDIARVPREEFAEMARRGEVSPATVVFDNTVSKVGDLRAGRWEIQAGEAWHARAFFQ